jgi:uncharacterized membrane protein (UPF0127 family)
MRAAQREEIVTTRVRLGLLALVFAFIGESFHGAEALPVETITIGTQRGPAKFAVEIAADAGSQEQGLMYRRSMAPSSGMIFDFGRPEFVMFWMKNTYIPLDMLFVKPDGTISSITEDAKPMTLTSIPSIEPVSAVIELNAGRAHALGIVPGDKVHAPEFGNGAKSH